MGTYELPAEPSVARLWTQDERGHITPWDREATPTEHVWRAGGLRRTWVELFGEGRVHDVHPLLESSAPLPWQVDLGCVVDSDGNVVEAHCKRNGPLIVRAVNAYAERIAGGES